MNPLSATKPVWQKRWYRLLMAGGVVYTISWSVLLYFGWKDSPIIILWCDVITGIFLLQLSYRIYRYGDRFPEAAPPLRLAWLIGLLYASTWTVIIMATFGSEWLLPADLISLFITLSLSRTLWHTFFPSATGKK